MSRCRSKMPCRTWPSSTRCSPPRKPGAGRRRTNVSIYLGLDSSTQSITATAIEIDGNRRSILFERSFRYDEVLPGYATKYGVLSSADPAVVHGPPLMWSEALDRMVAEIVAKEHVDWQQLRAISGSAQ